MKLLRLVIDNFLSIGHADINLDGNGLVLIEGRSHDRPSADSNAAGKSSMFVDAPIWALYDHLMRDISKDGVVNDKIGKDCCVRVVFEHSGKQHEVARYREHRDHGNDVKYLIDGVDVTGTTPTVTQKSIEDHLGIPKEVFLHTVVIGQGFQHRLSALTDGDRKQLLEDLLVAGHPTSGATAFDAARENAHKAKGSAETKLTVAQTRLGMLKSEEEHIKKALADHEKVKIEWELRRTEGVNTRAKVVEQLSFDCSAKLKQLNTLVDTINSDEATLATLKEAHRKYLSAQASAGIEHELARAEVGRLTVSLDTLPTDKCPTCFRDFNDDARLPVVDDLVKGLRDANALLLAKTTEHDIAVQASELSTHRIVTAEKSLKEMSAMRSGLNADIVNYSERQSQMLSELERLKKELNPHEGQASVLEKRLAEIASEIKHAAESVEKTSRAIELSKFWMSGFQALRGRALSQILRFLNGRLSYYLSILSEEDMTMEMVLQQKGRTKEEIAINVNGKPYGGASAGERRRVDVSIALAMHDLATVLTGFRCNVMVVDEIGDALDGSGVDRLVQILEEKAHDISTIFVISHDLKLRARIPKKWVVERTDRVSSLTISG